MGLDMYLIKAKRKRGRISKRIHDIDDVYDDYSFIGQWRKANHIHKWFVDHVQDGFDNCEFYQVTKEQLIELRDTCKKVIDASTLVDGKVIGSYGFKKKFIFFGPAVSKPNYVKGLRIKNAKVAKELLPCQAGFFFGTTDYDEWYYNNTMYTMNLINDILNGEVVVKDYTYSEKDNKYVEVERTYKTDVDKDVYYYNSSW